MAMAVVLGKRPPAMSPVAGALVPAPAIPPPPPAADAAAAVRAPSFLASLAVHDWPGRQGRSAWVQRQKNVVFLNSPCYEAPINSIFKKNEVGRYFKILTPKPKTTSPISYCFFCRPSRNNGICSAGKQGFAVKEQEQRDSYKTIVYVSPPAHQCQITNPEGRSCKGWVLFFEIFVFFSTKYFLCF
jgi:hypothetical protein